MLLSTQEEHPRFDSSVIALLIILQLSSCKPQTAHSSLERAQADVVVLLSVVERDRLVGGELCCIQSPDLADEQRRLWTDPVVVVVGVDVNGHKDDVYFLDEYMASEVIA